MTARSEPGAPAPRRKRRRRVSKPASKRPPKRAPAARRAAVLVLGSMAATIGGLALVLYVGFGGCKAQDRGAVLEIDWPAGAGPEAAAKILADAGLVRSEEAMAVFLRATGGTGDFAPGPHLLAAGATPWELKRLLSRSSGRPTARIVVPEGFNRFDIGARLQKLKIAGKQAFLNASADAALLDEVGVEHAGSVGAESAEGYLFPATYDLPLDSDPREIVKRFVAESDRRWEALVLEHAGGLASLHAPPLGWGRREVLTLASIVEKEAAVDDERPIIASVFLNRLLDPTFKPKRLQSDPTSQYGCLVAPADAPSCADFTGKPMPSINVDPKNRYSTYTHEGLPPGPIANPGVKSIQAVLTPAATKYLYFVATGGGRHTFSETLAAHNGAIRKSSAQAE